MSTSYNINSISIQHRYSVIIPGIGSSDRAGPYRAGKPRNWSTSRTSHDDFFEFLSSHSFRASSIILLTLSWKPGYGSYPPNVWRIWSKQDCREVILLWPIKRGNRAAKKPRRCKSSPLAAQRMEPSRKPEQDCQGEQALASAMKIKFTNQCVWLQNT